MDLIEKYKQDMTIRHDKEILSKFVDDLCLAFKNKGLLLSLVEKEKFINSWIENYYFRNYDNGT